MHTSRYYRSFRPLHPAFFGGRFRPAAGLLGLVLAAAPLSLRAQGEIPVAGVTDPVVAEYGPQLPVLRGSALGLGIGGCGTAPAGGGTWLTAWREGSYEVQSPLRIRILPAAFEEAAGGEFPADAGGPQLPPIQEAGMLDRTGIFQVTAAGNGVLVTWQTGNRVMMRLYNGTLGTAVGDGLPLSGEGDYATLLSAGSDGTTAWVVWSVILGTETMVFGAVVDVTAQGLKKISGFRLPNNFQPVPQAAARGEFCLFSTSSGYPDYVGITVRVDATGAVSAPKYVETDFLEVWLGVIPHPDGWYAVTARYAQAARTWTLQGRWLSMDGSWPESSKAEALGLVPDSTDQIYFFPGMSGGIVYLATSSGTPAWRVIPGQPMVPLVQDFSGPVHGISYALDQTRVLALNAGGKNDVLQARRIYTDNTRPPVTAKMTEGAGHQSALSLWWTARGPQAVFQLEGYVPAGASAEVTGYNKRADSSAGLPLSYLWFSSPAQAWIGSTQLIAYRHWGALADPGADVADDVSGVIFKEAGDGSLSAAGAPFVIATGKASQRGVAVAASDSERFLAVWREESGDYPDHYVATVRAAYIKIDGSVNPTDGKILDISTREISAVSVAGGAYGCTVLWKQTQGQNPKRSEIRMVEMNGAPELPAARTISPPAHDAVGPQGLILGNRVVTVWRDKRTGRIFCNQGYVLVGLEPADAVAVSEARYEAREPGLAALSADTAAIFWLDAETATGPVRVMVSILDLSGAMTLTPPVQLARGNFNQELLSVSGDGKGRVAVGITDLGNAAAGLRIFVVAPSVSSQGGLRLEVTGGGAGNGGGAGEGEARVSWDTSTVFPGAAETVEASADLLDWKPATGLPPVPVTSDSSGRSTLSLPMPTGDARRYFRLKAALK